MNKYRQTIALCDAPLSRIAMHIIAFLAVSVSVAHAHEASSMAARQIAIRESPSPRADAIESIDAGSSVQVDSSRNPRRGYLPVLTSSGEQGWIWPGEIKAVGQSFRDTARLADRVSTQQGFEASLPSARETRFLADIRLREQVLSRESNTRPIAPWVLRSQHILFGLPEPVDDRHHFKPEAVSNYQIGISVLVREGFVIGHFDRMKAPLWVAQRWTKFDRERAIRLPGLDRPWKEDPELPPYATGGTTYNTNETRLDRGHMARHESNRAWGIDSSNWGVKMSNSAPQYTSINRYGLWRTLEDEIRDVVGKEAVAIDAAWVIAGTIFLPSGADTQNVEQVFSSVGRIPSGDFGVPYATYKIVSWFDVEGELQMRAYLFPQPYKVDQDSSEFVFEIPENASALTDLIVPVNEIERRTGLDFFPNLQDEIEEDVESAVYSNVWGQPD